MQVGNVNIKDFFPRQILFSKSLLIISAVLCKNLMKFNWPLSKILIHAVNILFNPLFIKIIFLFFLQLDRTALHWAAAEGNIDIIQLLLDNGTDVEVRDKVSLKLTNKSVLNLISSFGFRRSLRLSETFHVPHPLKTLAIMALQNLLSPLRLNKE